MAALSIECLWATYEHVQTPYTQRTKFRTQSCRRTTFGHFCRTRACSARRTTKTRTTCVQCAYVMSYACVPDNVCRTLSVRLSYACTRLSAHHSAPRKKLEEKAPVWDRVKTPVIIARRHGLCVQAPHGWCPQANPCSISSTSCWKTQAMP